MNILKARQADGSAQSVKEDSAVHNHELRINGDVATDTDRDTADMQKLGVRQETKVWAVGSRCNGAD